MKTYLVGAQVSIAHDNTVINILKTWINKTEQEVLEDIQRDPSCLRNSLTEDYQKDFYKQHKPKKRRSNLSSRNEEKLALYLERNTVGYDWNTIIEKVKGANIYKLTKQKLRKFVKDFFEEDKEYINSMSINEFKQVLYKKRAGNADTFQRYFLCNDLESFLGFVKGSFSYI